MNDVKKESWLNWMAVTTILFSTCATLSTFKGGGMSSKALLSQTQASDQWAYYQAKSIKQHSFEVAKDQMELARLSAAASQAKAYDDKIKEYTTAIARYAAEKKDAEKSAHDFEETRKTCQAYGTVFGKAVIYLQMAIVLSALAGLLKKKPLWLAGSISGVVGLAYFIHALIL